MTSGSAASDERHDTGQHERRDEDRVVPAEQLRDAVVMVAQCEGPSAAADLVGRHWDMYAGTAAEHLLAAVRALPGEVFVDNAGMLVAANYLQHVVSGGAPHRFEQDPRLASAPDDPSRSLAEQLIGLTGTAATERTRGNYARAADAAREARRRLNVAEDGDVAPIRSNLPHLFLQWGRALEDRGDDGVDAEFEYEESHRLGLATNQPQIARRAAGHLAWYHAFRGRLSLSDDWLDRARSTGEPVPRYDAVNHLTAALLALDRHDAVGAGEELRLLDGHEIGEYWAAALWVKSFAVHSARDRAHLESDTAREVGRRPPAVTSDGVNGRLLQATWMRLGHPVASTPHSTASEAALEAALEYRRGDYRRAVRAAAAATGPSSTPRVRAGALLVTAASAHGLGRASVAHETFELAHSIIERESIRTTYETISREHLDALAVAVLGETVSTSVARPSTSDAGVLLARLTRRERQVLVMLLSDRPMAAIARELFISPNTLKGTTRRLYRKLCVSSRSAAAEVAHRAGVHAEEGVAAVTPVPRVPSRLDPRE